METKIKMMSPVALNRHMELNGLHVDKLGRNKDGRYAVRRSFFYTFGQTEDEWGAKVQSALPAGYKVIESIQEWKRWPQVSYFCAIVIAPQTW